MYTIFNPVQIPNKLTHYTLTDVQFMYTFKYMLAGMYKIYFARGVNFKPELSKV